MANKYPSADWLCDHGYNGLCLPGKCGCRLDDLRPCCEVSDQCVPGYVGGNGLMYVSKEAALAAKEQPDG